MSEFDAVEILLAEDSDRDAELTVRALKKGNILNKLVRVKDGAEALDFLFLGGDFAGRAAGNPRLVLLDLKMPRMDGIEVLRRIRADERTHKVPCGDVDLVGRGKRPRCQQLPGQAGGIRQIRLGRERGRAVLDADEPDARMARPACLRRE